MAINIVNSYLKELKRSNNFDSTMRIIDDIRDENDLESLKDILNNCTIAFEVRCNRLQSLILCESKNSYSIQSQRYCRYNENSDVIIDGLSDLSLDDELNNRLMEYVNRSLEIYLDMTKLKPGCENKTKFKKDDFVNGIGVEDARNILPMVFPCYMVMTVKGGNLLDLIIDLYEYESIFKSLIRDLLEILNLNISLERILKTKGNNKIKFHNILDTYILGQKYTHLVKRNIIDTNDNLNISGVAALTCTNEKSPTDILNENVNSKNNTLDKVTNRVVDMNHISILEHNYVNISYALSVSAYNQYIRHRLQNVNRMSFKYILKNGLFNIPHIKLHSDVWYYNIINNRIISNCLTDFSNISLEILLDIVKEDHNKAMILSQFFVMGTAIPFIVNSNITNELYIAEKRTCLNAQWEIREFTHNKIKALKEILSDNHILDRATPPCLKKGCQEGKGSCGNNIEVKKLFNK